MTAVMSEAVYPLKDPEPDDVETWVGGRPVSISYAVISFSNCSTICQKTKIALLSPQDDFKMSVKKGGNLLFY